MLDTAKFLSITGLSIICLAPWSAMASVSPVQNVPPQQQDLPACYIQTGTGKVINLSKNCGFVRPASCATSLGSASRDAVLIDFCKRNEKCLLNSTCNEIPRGVKTPPPGTPMGRQDSKQVIA
jgi:hypothetical protein